MTSRISAAILAATLAATVAVTVLAPRADAQRSAGAANSAAPDWSAFDKYVAQAARDWHVPALAIAVVKDDSVVFAKGYGVLQVGTDKRADEHTRFAIGSTTKAMTSAALAMLVDEGKLRWDDRVTKYIPELEMYDPYVTRELTVRDLLTHRTGLPGTDLFWYQWHYATAEIIRRLRFIKPESSFRSNWDYQNVMYSLGGVIVERASGMSWDAFIRQRIFAPLGMNESETTVAAISGKANVAVPHYEIRDTVRVTPVRSTDAIAPAGSVWSSVSDMSKWMRFILDSGRVGSKQLIKPATFRELIAPQIRAPVEEYPALQLAKPTFFSYGLGWFVQDYRERPVWMHTGSIDGMCAIIGLLPNEHVGVYVLENLDHAEVRHALMYSVFDMYAGGSTRDWSADLHGLFDKAREARASRVATATPPAVGKPSLPLERYAGTYADSAYGSVVVSFANGKLSAQVVTDPMRELESVTFDSFRTQPSNPNEAVEITFLPNGIGGVSGLQIEGVMFGKVRMPRPAESR